MSETTLRVIATSSLQDPVAKLRVLADAIEAGKHGTPRIVAVVMHGSAGLSVHSFGPDSLPSQTGMVLHAGCD